MKGWGVTRVWLFGCGRDEKNIVPGPRCLTGGCQVLQKNWGNFDHAYVEFCFVALATDARLCTGDAKNWGNFYHAYVEFCFLPLASKHFRDAKYPLTVTKVYSTFG